ncbi:putative fatty acyl-CoA reductase CG5065 [Sitodiplosis mosellana]|uniref:putative fatty acyl-CoA reductase CG5065 n=1 Tax=Sitodiplosis mosellana TaxID=263140 RepID=UPI002443837F|nr:putative fatty acyl-CoA reductase CG5065 [Sitodiplosis mosellana]XP_055319043.1 putative fatty acyl-CoA reductase CG5065 [Sitodiplosis mosellana]XP_055319044.1 putative fatty acyl-CoA reductase CG5065 [Sitodiplosis mosellana]XP_055319045.1 putative fatty acyl-CoA reductase CG5065 [Sitodiplosis mosellana]XP_055319047.1 putative fatty acyl-CoA reductase CG5065 [Sitodiplosis mosellana]XP_055319048.1 putative fatty acyl-CoA reductase CG5065 [Sitodiplosis mosellana]XP_055319049.1 putative fatty
MATPPEVDQDQNMYVNFDSKGPYISIPQFYAGRSVFITGGTGFMGKVLVEKLLRSCPEIQNIYLLMRPKRGQEVSARLNELLNSPLFDTIRKEKPNELNKVIPICGDITLHQLGISESDQALLCRNVSVVFHSAATVKFDEKLELSVKINMLGTKRLVELCHRMMNLDALVHVSTAYCNCDRTEIQEVIYPTPYDPANIINLISWLPEDVLDKLTPSLIGKRPNTYTFTKALTEQMLLEEAGNLPVAIVRPSIVIACHSEPAAGWLDNWNGPTAIISAVGNGLFRTIICEKDFLCDVIPVDIVINLVITTAWRTATTKSRNMKIYNCVTSRQQPITWGEFVGYSIRNMIRHPMEGVVWYPTGALRMNRFINAIQGYLVHYIPAYFLDMFAWAMGKKPIMIKIQNKLEKAVGCLEYFTTHQWRFTDDNVRELLTHMSATDRSTFQFDVTHIDWDAYFERYILGLRAFLCKQNPKTLPSSRKKMTRLYVVHQMSKILIVIFTWRFLMARSKKIRDAWSGILRIILQTLSLLPFF